MGMGINMSDLNSDNKLIDALERQAQPENLSRVTSEVWYGDVRVSPLITGLLYRPGQGSRIRFARAPANSRSSWANPQPAWVAR